MGDAIFEAVPNVSVGRDRAVVARLMAAVRHALHDVKQRGGRGLLADVHSDDDHDRSVLTIVGNEIAIECALVALAREAIASIDVRKVMGVHPRVGALDVCPIIPLSSRGESPNWGAALMLRDRVASRIGEELDVPVVAYGVINSDGTLDEHAPFAGAARRGGIDTLVDRIALGELTQLAGPYGEAHPSAGVVLIGVRDVLVAFNVVLGTNDVTHARRIAEQLRASARGEQSLDGVRALGFELASQHLVQVSTNIEQVEKVGPARVLDAVVRLGREDCIDVESAELVGLCPGPALAALRYACVRAGVALRCAQRASLDEAVGELRRD